MQKGEKEEKKSGRRGEVRTGMEGRRAEGGGKKTSASTSRFESSQNEVRPHEPYINQPRPLSLSFFSSAGLALFIFALIVPRPALPRRSPGAVLSRAHIKRF